MIPAEAVEAAAKAYRHALPYMSGEKALIEALEAAAPYMLPDFRESNRKAIEYHIANPLKLRSREDSTNGND